MIRAGGRVKVLYIVAGVNEKHSRMKNKRKNREIKDRKKKFKSKKCVYGKSFLFIRIDKILSRRILAFWLRVDEKSEWFL